jgi:hypothetical protein
MFYSKFNGGFYDTAINVDNIPEDAVEVTTEQHAALLEGQSQGKIISADENGHPILIDPPRPTTDQIIAGFVSAIQQRLDDFAKTRGYDGIMSACTYATSTVPKFQSEGQYCVGARDDTWSTAYDMLEDVQSGADVPTMEDVMASLPVLAWPN